MDRKSTEKLRLDRRLSGRKNWVSPKEIEQEVEALPDVSHKIAEVKEKSDSGDGNADIAEAKPTDTGSLIADSSVPSQS
jgi:hypothetical protein